MDELVKTFHIDWHLLLAQMINFSIVVVVLGYFAVKPLTKLMHEREKKIADGLEHAALAEKNLAESEQVKLEKIKEGRQEAMKIVETAEKDLEAVRQEKVAKTQEEVRKIVNDGKSKLNSEQELMYGQVKNGAGEVVILAMQKVLGRSLDEKTHKKLIDEAITELESMDVV